VGLELRKRAERSGWAQHAHGAYLLRTNCPEREPARVWKWYLQLQAAEAAFRICKSDLRLRPISHHKAKRVEAHILVCFPAFALWRTLEQWMSAKGLGPCARQLLHEVATVRSLDVVLPLKDHGDLRLVSKPDRPFSSWGQSGLAGNEITFETEGCARDLRDALQALGIASVVVQAGKQFKVRLSILPAVETPPPVAVPAEIPSPAPINGVAETAKTAQNIPNFIPEASVPAPAAEKRRRFAELARQEHVETARKLAEEQAQLELSFSMAKGKRKPFKRPERP